jgi:BirA family transcriptional regulator, biotin operon repressor / biotin---[acetyl-CoA-carboxylase] ligase
MEYPKASQVASGLEFLAETGSTNQDLAALAKKSDLPEFFTLVTDFQTAGRGRLDRAWEAPFASSVMASVYLKPRFENSSGLGWISLLVAQAIKQTIDDLGLSAKIKWPNDVLISGSKVSGVLAEVSQDLDSVVVGFGINVSQEAKDLPVQTATSLLLSGASSLDRDLLLAKTLSNIKVLYSQLATAGGDAQACGLRQQLLESSATIGQLVEVMFKDQESVQGKAVDIDDTGRLVVKTQTKTLAVSAGDILHLRAHEMDD